MPRISKLANEQMLRVAINSSKSYREILIKMQLSAAATNYVTLKKYIKSFNIDITHLRPNDGRVKALKKYTDKAKIPLNEIIEYNMHPNYATGHLKRRLLQDNIIDEICKLCEQGATWNNKPLILQLDHIDGNNKNHHLTNLRLLCPNCHTQTPTWGFKKRKTQFESV